MAIEPFVQCSDINQSLQFYTEVLDFVVVQAPDPDPESLLAGYAFMAREGSGVHLSTHSGDGVAGITLFIRVENIDVLYQQFIENGLDLDTVRIKPVDQTWGVREFGVSDPDGNKLTFGHQL